MAVSDPLPVTSRIAAAVCVYTDERWDWIGEAIGSLQRQTRPPDELIVVVDHNPALAERMVTAYADQGVVVLENEEGQGLSGGKNTALRHCTSDLLAFLDDDAVADPDWIEALSAAASEPDVAGAGSRVDPNWESPTSWLPEEFWWTVGCSHRGLPTKPASVRNTFGGASVVRVDAARRVDGFSSQLGRGADNLGGAEETEFCIRLTTATGGALRYIPTTSIAHRVPASRCTWSYFVRRCYGEGLSKAVVSELVGSDRALSSERDYVRHTLPAGFARYSSQFVRGDRGAAGRAAALVVGLGATTLGYGRGLIRRRGLSPS